MKPHLVLLLIWGVFSGCLFGGGQEGGPAMTNDYPRHIDFSKWRTWQRLNDEPFESHEHNAYTDLYVNEKAAKTYAEASAPYLPGSAVIKPLYPDAERSRIARLVIMVKMDPMYSPEFGDWWYGVYDEHGVEAWEQGTIGSCILCHLRAKETDYMFSKEVMAKIRRQR